MAVTKIWKVVKRMDHVIDYAKDKNKTKIELNQNYEILVDDLQNVIDYARNSDKTEKEFYVSGINCETNSAYEEMQDTKRFYKQLFDVFGGCCIVYRIHCTTQCVWRRDHAHVRIHLSFGAQRDDIFCRRLVTFYMLFLLLLELVPCNNFPI